MKISESVLGPVIRAILVDGDEDVACPECVDHVPDLVDEVGTEDDLVVPWQAGYEDFLCVATPWLRVVGGGQIAMDIECFEKCPDEEDQDRQSEQAGPEDMAGGSEQHLVGIIRPSMDVTPVMTEDVWTSLICVLRVEEQRRKCVERDAQSYYSDISAPQRTPVLQ